MDWYDVLISRRGHYTVTSGTMQAKCLQSVIVEKKTKKTMWVSLINDEAAWAHLWKGKWGYVCILLHHVMGKMVQQKEESLPESQHCSVFNLESRFLSVICSVIKKFHKNVSPGVCCCCKKSKFRPRKEVLTTISCWHAGKACFPFNSFLHRFLLWLKFSQLCSKAYCFNICFLILLMFSKLVVL